MIQHQLGRGLLCSCALLLAACSSGGGGGGAGGDDCYECFACATDADCPGQHCCPEGDIPSCKDECQGAGGSGGRSECQVGCDKLIECLGAANVSANCVLGCERARGSADGARTRSCLTCMAENPCSAIFPESGTATACTLECGDGSLGQCEPGKGLSAFDSICHAMCADVADCYSAAAYCASDALCYGVELFATCGRVASLPGPGVDAPLLFDPGQDMIGTAGELCTKQPATCANNGSVCRFSLQYYDPNGDVPAGRTELLSLLRMVGTDGSLLDPYDVLAADGNTLAILGCFPESETTIEAAVVLLDDAGNQSNPLCFTGSAP